MDKNNELLQEIHEDFGEWIEMDSSGEVLTNILCSLLIKERDKANQYKMALKRCELTHR